MRLLLLPMVGLILWSGQSVAKTLEEINQCMRANVPDTLQIREFEIDATSASGEEETLVGRLYARHEDERFSAMMSLTAPYDLQGAAYLVREARQEGKEEELHVYLPALRKTRRVTGNMKNQSLFGTDFSYSDLRRVAFAIADESVSLEREESLGDRPTWVLSLKPAPESGEAFDQLLTWVDQQSCLVLKADFLSGEVVTKRFSAKPEHLQQSGPHWYFSQAQIESLDNKSVTVIRVREVLSNEDLASRIFNPRMFHLAR